MVEICIEHCSRLPAAPPLAWREHDSSILTFDDLADRISSRPAITEKIMNDVTRALRHQEARDIARGMVAVIDRARDATTSAASAQASLQAVRLH